MKLVAALLCLLPGTAQDPADELLKKIGAKRGICAVVGVERDALPVEIARGSGLLVFAQASNVDAIRKAADEAGLLGTRVWAEPGKLDHLHLADNVADAVIAGPGVSRAEVVRILRPGGKGFLGREEVTKAIPDGADDWTHPYHGPDNNPQSKDRLARGPFMTQFMATPWYSSMPQQSVISGGRIFKVFGNRTSAQPQWRVTDSLYCLSAWNGTTLWTRKLSPGFMIHRNTMIATPDLLYLGDDVSCKRIDAATGEVKDEIVVPDGLSDGPVWKWMAMDKGILYALVGEKEKSLEPVQTGAFRGAGWPWWKIPDYSFGFGRTVLAIDLATKKVLWNHRADDPIDARAMGLSSGRLFIYSHKKSLGALDAASGKVLWKTSDEKVMAGIGEHDAAQHPMKGYLSASYVKCSEKAVYFAGAMRANILAVSAEDGRFLWQLPGGNSQLVLRDDAVYSLGEGRINGVESSLKIQPLTGEILARFPSRDRCTRATGSEQYIFTRGGQGGSTAVFDVQSAQPKKGGVISPMRPACHDGVVVANGLFYWGPWMCRCDGTQIGIISLASGGSFDYAAEAKESERLVAPGGEIAALPVAGEDWPTFRKDNARSTRTSMSVPAQVAKKWEFSPRAPGVVTSPVAVRGRIFVAGADGIVRSLDAATGEERWRAYTGGDVKYPPSIANGRAYVGSGDGWVYCFEATSGKLLWRFRAAPAERTIPLYDVLSSTWPVGSGVLVEDGVAYAAAGNANFDGTHVYALDGGSGKIRWQNNTSGHLADERQDSGAGVQGHLLLHEGALYMSGGNLVPVARYELGTGAFSRLAGGRGKDLFVIDGKVQATGYALYWRQEDAHFIAFASFPVKDGLVAVTEAAGVGLAQPERDAKGQPKFIWSAKAFMDIAAVVVAKDAILVAGVDRTGTGDKVRSTAGIAALALDGGKVLWKHELPASPVGWGIAVDRDGRILVSLQDGRVACFASE